MKLLINKAIILLLPFIVLMGIFVGLDPMKVFHQYKSPVSKGVLMNDRFFKTKYLNTTNIDYNSFIFGSSRSSAFKTFNWNKYIESNNIYHFGVNDESLYGLICKLSYLDTEGFQIKNALIVLDHRILSLTKNHVTHVFTEPPPITGESKVEFYKRFFFAFLNPDFLIQYTAFRFTGEIKTKSQKLWNPGFSFNRVSGDIIYSRMDSLLKRDSIYYYKNHASGFYNRNYIKKYLSEPVIGSISISYLMQMKVIFDKHKTNYRIIVTPNYDQKEIDNYDFQLLNNIFRKEYVSDFSGVNKITNEIGNYYEERHFKPYIANKLMKEVY